MLLSLVNFSKHTTYNVDAFTTREVISDKRDTHIKKKKSVDRKIKQIKNEFCLYALPQAILHRKDIY